jgi:hypothetical protein
MILYILFYFYKNQTLKKKEVLFEQSAVQKQKTEPIQISSTLNSSEILDTHI